MQAPDGPVKAADRQAALGLLAAFKMMRTCFFVRGSLVRERMQRQAIADKMDPRHPIFELPWMRPVLEDGSWERWCNLIIKIQGHTNDLYLRLHDPTIPECLLLIKFPE